MRRNRHRHPTASLGPGVSSYRGFRIELYAPAMYRFDTGHFIPAVYYVMGGRKSRYRFESLESARQMIDDALDP